MPVPFLHKERKMLVYFFSPILAIFFEKLRLNSVVVLKILQILGTYAHVVSQILHN